jgi:hypothetical protein
MAFPQGYNPFASQEIKVSPAFHELLQDLVKRGSSDVEGNGSSSAPFKRMVDAWLVAVSLGASIGIDPPEFSDKDTVKFMQGNVLEKDLGAIEYLMALAIAESGDPYIVENPKKMMDIAKGFGELGFPKLKELTESGYLERTENIARGLIKTLREEMITG